MILVRRNVLGAIVLGALLWGLVDLAFLLSATGGHLSMPLDDAYIFFQYARRVVEGAPFTYQQGAGVSLGATSPLTVAIHAVGYLIGFRGASMALFAILAGVAGLVWAAWSAYVLGRRLTPAVAWLPPLLLLVSGPVIWASLSGMDFIFFLAPALAVAAAWPSAGEPPPRRIFVFASLLALARPDAVFLVVPAAVVGLLFHRRRPGWIVPLLFVALPFLVQWLLTGSPQSASMDVKSVLSQAGLTRTEWMAGSLSYLQIAVRGIFEGGIVREAHQMAANNGSAMGFYLVPFALALLLLGLVPGAWLECRDRRPGPQTLLLAWIVLSVAAVSFTVPRNWHWNRYLIPSFALSLIGISVGAARLGHGLERLWPELRPREGARIVGGVLVVLSLPGAAYFAVAYGRNAADIYFQHIELAHGLNVEGPTHPRILGTHDAGALAYFSGGYRLLDLEGLVSPEFRHAARLGSAGIWEELERLPAGDRPDILAVYPNWFESSFLAPHQLLYSQRVFHPTIAGGNPLNVYRADWSLAGRGDLPRDPGVLQQLGPARLVDEVDVADVEDEEAHRYRIGVLDWAYESLLRDLPGADGVQVMDGGRMVSGWEEFTLRGVDPARPLLLVLRTHAPFRIRVEADGVPVGMWVSEGAGSSGWSESMFAVGQNALGTETVRLRLASADPHHSAYGSFHYWAYQP